VVEGAAWIVAGHALERLPLVSEALTGGRLSLDKVVELARFATAETEARLISMGRPGLGGRDPPPGRRDGSRRS
jgi:hypothetical protein